MKQNKQEYIQNLAQQTSDFIENFWKENPIYGDLNLSEEQMEILCEKLIFPMLKEKLFVGESSYHIMQATKKAYALNFRKQHGI